MEHEPLANDTLLVGVVVGVFGVRGQLKVRSLTSDLDHLRHRVRTVYVGEKLRPYPIIDLFEHKPGLVVMRLEGITTREQAEELRGADVAIRAHDAAPLAEGEYFLHDLPGLRVATEDGTTIGVVRDYLETGANEVIVVTREGAPEALIPLIHDVVVELNIAERRIVIRPIPGLLDADTDKEASS